MGGGLIGQPTLSSPGAEVEVNSFSHACLLLICHPPTSRELYERLEEVGMNDKSSHVGMWNTSSLLSVEIPAVANDVLRTPCQIANPTDS